MDTKIMQAGPEHPDIICEIAEKTWWPAYREILSAEQIRYMLDSIYARDNVLKQLETSSQTYLLLMMEGQAKGFAAFSPREEDPDVFKLHKLYCLPEIQGRGGGRLLLEAVCQQVTSAGKQVLELNVNRYNKAKSFYEKQGFVVAYEEDIPIGPYWMNDIVMRKILPASS